MFIKFNPESSVSVLTKPNNKKSIRTQTDCGCLFYFN